MLLMNVAWVQDSCPCCALPFHGSSSQHQATLVAVQMAMAYSGSMAQDSDSLPRPSLVLQLQREVQRLEQEKQSAVERSEALEEEQSNLLCEVCCTGPNSCTYLHSACVRCTAGKCKALSNCSWHVQDLL